jgi:hypothetical protein
LLKKFAAHVPAPARPALFALLFFVAWAFLDAVFNLRYPNPAYEPKGWYLLPSLDVLALLAVFSILGWRRIRTPAAVTIAFTIAAAVVRLLRTADGLMWVAAFRPINVALDYPLLRDLLEHLRASNSVARLVVGAVVLAALTAVFLFLVYFALVSTQRYLARGTRERLVMAGAVVAATALSPLWRADHSPDLHLGLFGRSVVPVAIDQAHLVEPTTVAKQHKMEEIRAVQAQLAATPSDLKELNGADVLVFIIESYGSIAFRDRRIVSMRCPPLEEFGTALAARGYHAASSLVNSTTYGGGSWMPQTTFATGIFVGNAFDYSVVRYADPPPRTMAETFKNAGYHTVLVAAGTIWSWPEGLIRGFDRRYYEADLEYAGPSFGWASMPDEYVVDFVHRHEVARARSPLFVEYVLMSSHAPWAKIPLPVGDPSKLDHGRVYLDGGHVAQFPLHWGNVDQGAPAYAYSLCYDFEVIKQYVLERITRDTLIVIWGDHQPSPLLTGNDPSWAVPVHVLSRNPRIIERFNSAGYTTGMIPPQTGTAAPLTTIFPQLMEALSRPRAQEHRDP